MAPKRGTKAHHNEVTEVFYGIDRKTFEVRTITISRDRVMTMWTDDATMLKHPLSGRDPRAEIAVVWGLTGVEGTLVSAEYPNNPLRKRMLAKAEQLRLEASS